MADLTTLRIKSPYGIESVEALSFSVRPNEHGVLRLSGIASEEAGFDPAFRAGESDEVTLTDFSEDEKGKTLFRGFVRDVEIAREGGLFRIKLTAMTGTILLDEEKKNRSFQDEGMTWDELFSEAAGDVQTLIHTDAWQDRVGFPALQYKETDWEFLLRMASRLGTALIPDAKTLGLHAGLPEGRRVELTNPSSHTAAKDLKDYLEKTAARYETFAQDYLTYNVTEKKSFGVGDRLVFARRPLRITGLSAELSRGELVYAYTLASEENLWRPALPGPFEGISLEGRVLETKGESLRLHLDIDEEQDREKAHFFPWSPITGNPMYAMPIVDTKVRLYFPDGLEENAFAADCVRENGDVCPETSDPNTRYFRTEHGKELMMAPSKLRFKDTNPNTEGKLLLELDDDFGIRLGSHKDINISANGSVDMSAGGSVLFSAPSNILFSQTKTIRDAGGKRFTIPESSFSLENETHIRAKAVNHRGLSRVPQVLFANSFTPSPGAEDGRAAKGLAKTEKAKGFNLGGLLKAAVAVCAVCAFAAAVAATGGAGLALALPLACMAVGAMGALGMAGVRDCKEDRHRSAADYLKEALNGGLVGAATGANPALVLKAVAALLLLPPLLLVGCGREEKAEELPEPGKPEGTFKKKNKEAVKVVNDWLRLYDTPTLDAEPKHTVTLTPDLYNTGTDEEAYNRKRKAWVGFEGKKDINAHAKEQISNNDIYDTIDFVINKPLDGPNVPSETHQKLNKVNGLGILEDPNGRYWVAVGPKIMIPHFSYSDNIWAENFRYGARLDAVISDSAGNLYYIPCVVGDIKAHTYPTGVVQTGIPFTDNATEREKNEVATANDGSVIEFIGAIISYELSDYTIEEVILYDYGYSDKYDKAHPQE